MAEGTGLENRHTGNGIESSNLSLSALKRKEESGKRKRNPPSVFRLPAVKDGWPSGLRRTPGKRVDGLNRLVSSNLTPSA